MSEQTARFSRDQGLSVTENILTGLADTPQVIVAANDDMALGAAQAVDARGLKGKIAIFGYDGSTDALAAVKDGSLAATVDQFPGKQGRVAVKTLVDYIREGTKPESVEHPLGARRHHHGQFDRGGAGRNHLAMIIEGGNASGKYPSGGAVPPDGAFLWVKNLSKSFFGVRRSIMSP